MTVNGNIYQIRNRHEKNWLHVILSILKRFISKVQNKFWKDVLQSFININKVKNSKQEQVLKVHYFIMKLEMCQYDTDAPT